jgi:hypothetical protein
MNVAEADEEKFSLIYNFHSECVGFNCARSLLITQIALLSLSFRRVLFFIPFLSPSRSRDAMREIEFEF